MPRQKKLQPIGKRLLKLRSEKKLTLKNLANETGLATKYISQIEKGEVIPPVAVLLQLSRALEIDSSILLREEKERVGKQSSDDYQKRTKAYTYETLTPEARHKHLKAFKIFVDPKSAHKGVSYQHLGEEFIYVLKGKIEVMVGENKNILGPGDCLHFNSSIVHKLR
ncbi:MAG: helix-turn-helix transcriptional regulator, partial [Deltaproteobacteria bacterium]|nr:helix-turn-helix transcriptional regulator [Deltaproteobacteria bacterium]